MFTNSHSRPLIISDSRHLKYRQRTRNARLGVLLTLLLLLLGSAITTRAQSSDVRISVESLSPPRVRVEGRRATPARAWSFRQTYAGISPGSERLENLSLTDAGGAVVAVRKLAPGEYESERPAVGFSYLVRLEPPLETSNAAHFSWLAGEYGVLMLGDLLPLPANAARVQFTLPAQWSLTSAETKTASSLYEITNAEDAVFFAGRNLRERRVVSSGSFTCDFATTGEWAFADEDAASAAAKILKHYEKILEFAPRRHTLFVLSPFPSQASAQAWSAETRGRTVFLLSGRWPSKTAALAQLNVPLTHELLHLWIPNALALDGEYDWFYEGFTLYQSLRAGVQLGYFSFQDYLNAVARAQDNYRAARGRQELSLLDASRQRWTGGANLVYNKGLLVAFLYDLTLRRQSSNKLSLDDVYRALFRRYGANADRRDGNDAAVEVLRSMNSMQSFTQAHILNASEVDLSSSVESFGLQVESMNARTRLTVAGSLNRSQRELLRKLGYNEPETRLDRGRTKP